MVSESRVQAVSNHKRHDAIIIAVCVLCCLSGCCLQVDNRQSSEPVITPEQAVKLCDRNFGIGGDGVRIKHLSNHNAVQHHQQRGSLLIEAPVLDHVGSACVDHIC